MSSGYSIRIIVGAGIPGHAAIQIDGPDSTRYLGMGPVEAGHAISDGSYDVSSLPKNVSPIGILRDLAPSRAQGLDHPTGTRRDVARRV